MNEPGAIPTGGMLQVQARAELPGSGECSVIRQAISCDICGAEKRQTNHWFVVCEQAGELRVSGWNSRNRLRPATKHLCGQTCLHKLVDEFIARAMAGKLAVHAAPAVDDDVQNETDASGTAGALEDEDESSARIIPAPPPVRPLPLPSTVLPMPAAKPLPSLVASAMEEMRPIPVTPRIEDAPNYASRRWRAEAWQRERDRTLRSTRPAH